MRHSNAAAGDAGDGAVANADTADSTIVPETSCTASFAALMRKSRREWAAVDMAELKSVLQSRGYADFIAISGPATHMAASNFCDG
jgi:hypothetical protein